ncbi:MAG: inorganic phosphate transporter [Candidatus Omnitrophota bacterium]|nr:inorganic phosphate transporter [Candidatus Omnitrophota bacterium]
MIAWLVFAVAFLAYANGANDNFKGVATLFGSRTTDYRKALWWATLTTFAGSCVALALSGGLVKAFSGQGLVPDLLTHDPQFLLAVGLGAALTVMLATTTGVPISTTHALTGGLVGAGLAAVGTVSADKLGQSFFMPLAVSPLVSFAATALLYPVFRLARLRLGIERQMCLCVDSGVPQPVMMQPNGVAVLRSTGLSLSVGQLSACADRYQGHVLGIDSQWVLDRLHFLSAGAVSFARGLNDTPKIAALLIAARALHVPLSAGLVAIGLAMAVGGLLNARRVAMTMSERITTMNHGQGFTANLVTAALVTLASQWGLPVSTTHVSCGSLFGLGTVNRSARWGVIRNIVLSWLVTLPLAALCAAAIYRFA